LFERPVANDHALLVHIDTDDAKRQRASARTEDDSVVVNQSARLDSSRQEFKELATSAGLEITDFVTGSRRRPDPRLFVGKGKLEEIKMALADTEAEVVLFGQRLSPSQERNLESELKVRVLDRNSLILDIFAQRARSFDGKLQVELAQLQHLSTRLVRGWTHLERQKGGIGLRGPVETQLKFAVSVSRAEPCAVNLASIRLPWSATPTLGNPRSLTDSPMRRCTRLINYSPHWTQP